MQIYSPARDLKKMECVSLMTKLSRSTNVLPPAAVVCKLAEKTKTQPINRTPPIRNAAMFTYDDGSSRLHSAVHVPSKRSLIGPSVLLTSFLLADENTDRRCGTATARRPDDGTRGTKALAQISLQLLLNCGSWKIFPAMFGL